MSASKASEWAKRLEEYIAENRPVLELASDDGEPSAFVDEYGDMEIRKRGTWAAKDAVELARWILNTFGDVREL